MATAREVLQFVDTDLECLLEVQDCPSASRVLPHFQDVTVKGMCG